MDVKLEQTANIKFCVKLGKSGAKTFQMIRRAYTNEAMSRIALSSISSDILFHSLPIWSTVIYTDIITTLFITVQHRHTLRSIILSHCTWQWTSWYD